MPRTGHRVSLIERVASILDRAGARYAVIGAAAMAARGVGRATRDVDLLTLSTVGLDHAWWTPLSDAGVSVSVVRGDADDPLAGVVRFEQDGERPVDLVVGRYRWQRRVLERAAPAVIGAASLPTALERDLVLLKLYAGGSQDAWDIEQLLACPDREALIAAVAADIDDLPARSRKLWKRILDPGE